MRHVLITGGTQGIGKKVSEHFLKQGYSATVNYRSNDTEANRMLSEFSAYKRNIQLLKADVTDLEAAASVVQETVKKWGRIDCFIHCTGPFIFERKPIIDHEPEEWDSMIRGNLSSVFYILKSLVPVMREQRFGRIVAFGFQNVSDAPGWPDHGPFASAKVALVSLIKTLAIEEAEHGITANMISPGIILPDMKAASIEEARLRPKKRTPFGRSVTGEDIARAAAFLCEEESQMVTGSILDLTGAVNVINRFRPTFDDD
jgi:3-oxoacyl-[acyl-carrier protein] reductase